MALKPYVVKVAVPYEDVMFNSAVIVDIMYIQGRLVLHAVDRATHFQEARFLHDIRPRQFGRPLRKCGLSSILVRLTTSDTTKAHGSSLLHSKRWLLKRESRADPNAMSVEERYHPALRKTFEKLLQTYGWKQCRRWLKSLEVPGAHPRTTVDKDGRRNEISM